MKSLKLSVAADQLSRPESPAWSQASGESVTLTGIPLGMQPTAYIVASRQDKPVGKVTQLEAKSLHNGTEIAFRLEWEDPVRNLEMLDTNTFADGAGLLFPLKGDAPLLTMGAEGQPVTAWHWRADRPEKANTNVAAGLGTTRVTDASAIAVSASWTDGRWSVVFRRALTVPAAADEALQLRVGETVKIAFAVWEGGNAERAGLKAFSPEWHEVVIEN